MNEDSRTFPPTDGDERATLAGFLQHHRDTLEWKCAGLDAAGLSATTAASAMTLGGLLKHLAFVEEYWCLHAIAGQAPGEPWASVDWKADPDWDWNSAKDDSPADLLALWKASVERSQASLDAAIDERGLDGAAAVTTPEGKAVSLRYVYVHLIEEYARHNGHADLLREAADGAVGE